MHGSSWMSCCQREKACMANVNRMIRQGIEYIKGLPDRWYVENPNKNVLDYLSKKYSRKFTKTFDEEGFGELHGEFAHIPHDICYSWEISQEEFDYAISIMEK